MRVPVFDVAAAVRSFGLEDAFLEDAFLDAHLDMTLYCFTKLTFTRRRARLLTGRDGTYRVGVGPGRSRLLAAQRRVKAACPPSATISETVLGVDLETRFVGRQYG